jgi:hypothetical protein
MHASSSRLHKDVYVVHGFLQVAAGQQYEAGSVHGKLSLWNLALDDSSVGLTSSVTDVLLAITKM